jgi:hypothetical protein
MARTASTRPFFFLCEFHSFDVRKARAATTEELARRDGGPLGLIETPRSYSAPATPLAKPNAGSSCSPRRDLTSRAAGISLGDGPAIRLVEAEREGIDQVVWDVRSLARAADWLRQQGWIGHVTDERIAIAPEALQGLDIRLSESA